MPSRNEVYRLSEDSDIPAATDSGTAFDNCQRFLSKAPTQFGFLESPLTD